VVEEAPRGGDDDFHAAAKGLDLCSMPTPP
jgi:hypothetical protein